MADREELAVNLAHGDDRNGHDRASWNVWPLALKLDHDFIHCATRHVAPARQHAFGADRVAVEWVMQVGVRGVVVIRIVRHMNDVPVVGAVHERRRRLP